MIELRGQLRNHLYSTFFAPRGSTRMYALGNQIAQQYLSPNDLLIGVIGEAGSGKSMLIKGMFPGLELTNDDSGLNIRPLPLMDLEAGGFFKPHTFHLDVRFESAFYQMYELADAISAAIDNGRRVIVEHYELVYPLLKRNANLLIGIGSEIIITRPTIFGPLPGDLADHVLPSIVFRKMAHSAEDLVEIFLPKELRDICEHGDIRHGFLITFPFKPQLCIPDLEKQVQALIEQDLSIDYIDDTHVKIGEYLHPCTGPRTHMVSTGKIEKFHLLPEFFYDPNIDAHHLVGLVGDEPNLRDNDYNKILL